MNWLYDVMDKVGLPTPPAFTAEGDAWGDCLRCGMGSPHSPCTCLLFCPHVGCEGLSETMPSEDPHDVPGQ